jgi:transcriptional regulator with XRE-family HTH domain
MEDFIARVMGVPIRSILAHWRSHVKRLPVWESMPQLLGAKIRYLRHQRKMTQGELGQSLDLASHGHITNVETTRRVASIDLVLRIADFFRVTTDYLLRDNVQVETVATAAINHSSLQKSQLRLFSVKLRHLRTRINLSQTDLAHHLALASRAYISNLEAGRKMPSLNLVVQISDLFGVTTDYLLRDTIPLVEGESATNISSA